MSDFNYAKLIFILIVYKNIGEAVKAYPKYFPNCHRFDKNLNSCLIEATEKVKPFLAKGVPELSLPPFEPFIIPEINLEQGTSALNFKAKLKNTEIYGLTNYTFSRFDFDVPNLQFFCDCTISHLQLKGNYTVTGKILIAPIVGTGSFSASVGSITNRVINDNVNELFEDLRPVLEKVMTDILEDLLFKAIESQIPYDKLYPPTS